MSTVYKQTTSDRFLNNICKASHDIVMYVAQETIVGSEKITDKDIC